MKLLNLNPLAQVGARYWKSVTFLILTLLTAGCVYKDSKEFVYPVKPPNTSGVEVNLNQAGSPIVLIQPTTFLFAVSPAGREYYDYVITFNGQSFAAGSSATNTLSFLVDPATMNNGVKTLEIKVGIPSGTGGLADQLGREEIIVDKTWNVDFETTVALNTPPIPAPNVFIQDGKSFIQWTAPTNLNFKKLVIVRHYLEGDHAIDSLEVFDKGSTLYWDNTYIGGTVEYSMVMVAYPFPVVGPTTYFQSAKAIAVFDSLSNPHTIRWEKPLLYANDIEFSIPDPVGNVHEFPLHDAGHFDLTNDNYVYLGHPIEFQLTLRPISSVLNHSMTTGVTGYLGSRIPAFQTIQFVPAQNAYLLVKGNLIYKVSLDYSIISTLAYDDPGNVADAPHMAISADGLYGYIPKVSATKVIQKIDLTSLTVAQSIDLSSYGAFTSTRNPIQLTDNNLLGFTTGGFNGGIVDLNSNQLLHTINSNILFFLSPDGEFMALYNTLYKGKGSWNTTVGTYPTPFFPGDNPVTIIQGGTNRLMRMDLGATKYFDVDATPNGDGSLQLLSTLPFQGTFDRISSTMSVYHPLGSIFELIVYSVPDQSIVTSLQFGNQFDGSKLFYQHGHFFHNNGFADN